MACIVCASGDLKKIQAYRFATPNSTLDEALNGAAIYVCGTCGAAQCNHATIDGDALHAYYKNSYRTQVHVAIGDELTYRRRALAVSAAVARHGDLRKPELNIFEPGAAFGHNLLAFRQHQPTARLATDEINEAMPNNAIRIETLTAAKRDIVILSHVLEHIPNPADFLRQVGDTMVSGGVLYIEVPNDILDAIRRNPYHEPHISFFDASSLSRLVAKGLPDFAIREVGVVGPKYSDYAPRGLLEKIRAKFIRLFYRLENLARGHGARAVPPQRTFERIAPQGNRVWLRMLLTKA